MNTKKPRKIIWKRILLGALIVIIIAVVGFVTWASLSMMQAEAIPYAEALSDTNVVIGKYDKFITIRPVNREPQNGFIFYPGALVEPEAYVWKLSKIAQVANIQVVIGRPHLNLAFFSINQAEDMFAALPDVKNWYIGGHSLGGSMACVYVSNHTAKVDGVILFGTYSGNDISGSSLKVMSINGDRDGIFPPSKVEEKRKELPKDTYFVKVPGMNHAQYGNYGPQTGDNKPSISDVEALQVLMNAFQTFFKAKKS